MFTVILDYLRGDTLESTSLIVLASDESDAREQAVQQLEEDKGALDYVAARVA